ncbi:nuclear transport factor 2 family protein [Dehalobacter sp. TBBPA1]|uniref:nuclear transport factor 2 family protein n=1 Tax=Dehalobacter sp. TBBPA1 TaxID=3235037 RepID=UPI0034A580F7
MSENLGNKENGSTKDLNRRGFLKTGAAVAAVGVMGAMAAPSQIANAATASLSATSKPKITSLFDILPYHNNGANVIDTANVKALVEYERYCRDTYHFDQMGACYADDSVIDTAWFHGTGKQFAEVSKKSGRGAKHKINSIIVWLNGNKAIAEMQAQMLGPRGQKINGIETDVVSYARLVYRVQKTNGRWLIKGFTPIYERDAFIPTIPTANFVYDENELNSYRASYKCVCYQLKGMGMSMNQDLPGEDKPETVEKVYQDVTAWLLK